MSGDCNLLDTTLEGALGVVDAEWTASVRGPKEASAPPQSTALLAAASSLVHLSACRPDTFGATRGHLLRVDGSERRDTTGMKQTSFA
mmetsp:Transcript_54539/g.95736  ORF Transcript_54539/g.95736 Transcript_54539/m.95736 type:complete len:88 (+) Transcript_54539:462-725(+)